jgi:hypothetical protein
MTSAEDAVDSPSLLNDIILHENDLTEQAKRQFGYHTDIFRAFELYRRSILENNRLTCVGRHLAFSTLEELHTTYKQVLNYVATNNVSQNLPDIGPLVICGLPRTGTTLLYNLLACDPNCRAPLYTEINVQSVPPISRSNLIEHERRAKKGELSEQARQQLAGRSSALSASHPSFVIEEDSLILVQAGMIDYFSIISSEDQFEPDAWFYDDTNKDFAYDYHKMFLCMLNSIDGPRSHWLLKSPEHALFLDVFFRHYPNAAMIMVHRRLDDVLPSYCSLAWAFNGIYFDENDSTARATLTTRALQRINKLIERIVEFRTRCHPSYDPSRKNIFDVNYDDLIEQPIVTVRHIYDHFNLNWSLEFEEAMNTWLLDNPQGKQGRHSYSLTEYGLNHEDIEARYADYINLFLRSPPSNIVNTKEVSSS